jgi:hypothetical protein
MSILALSPDIYGSYARFSAVADFLELHALKTPRRYVRAPDLERRLDTDSIRLNTPLGPSPTDPGQAAGIVFSILEERARILSAGYPFTVSLRDGLRARSSSVGVYRVLLALTAAHAYSIRTTDPKKLFEYLVARALATLGLRTATTGTSRRRRAGGFEAVLGAACSAVGLVASPHTGVISSAAQDEKVDTLAHLDLGDQRRGRWTFIGQATIAESAEWEKKASEPKPKLWRSLITDTHEPAPFLAVPHHVEPRHFENLHERAHAIVLDRLRLALTRITPTPQERRVVAAVAACQTEW